MSRRCHRAGLKAPALHEHLCAEVWSRCKCSAAVFSAACKTRFGASSTVIRSATRRVAFNALWIKLEHRVNSMTKHLVLLPGMDGTGQLFAGFLAALPDTFTATAVAYPADKFLSYPELHPFVSAAAPKDERFVLLAESFSTPLALEYAASSPPNLTGLIICAGFVSKPIAVWSQLAKAVARPWFFRLRAPRCILEYFLVGRDAPRSLIQKLRQVLRFVSPAVLSGRLREALNCDARSALARTRVPLMYVQATQDKLLAESCINEMKRIKPDILFVQVDGPHLLLQREPQKVANIVSTFVQETGS